jgi:hypothetical protein
MASGQAARLTGAGASLPTIIVIGWQEVSQRRERHKQPRENIDVSGLRQRLSHCFSDKRHIRKDGESLAISTVSGRVKSPDLSRFFQFFATW